MKKFKVKRRVRSSAPSPSPSPYETELYIGLDISLTDTGYAVLDQDFNFILYGSIKTTAKMPDHLRVVHIVGCITQMISGYAEDHKVRVFIEAIPFSNRPSGKTYTRTEIVGIVKYFLTIARTDTYMIGATTIKSKFCGDGKADKNAVQAAVYNRFRKLIKNDNIADAIAAAALGIDYTAKRIKLSIEKLPFEPL